VKKRKKKKFSRKEEKVERKQETKTEKPKFAKYYEANPVEKLDNDKFKIDSMEYRLVHNYRNAFNVEKLAERYSDILARYDYVVGDWGYEQLRLKGFFRSNNQQGFMDQKIDTLVDYLYEFCNFGCPFFVLERTGATPKIYNDFAHKDKHTFKNNHKNRIAKYHARNEEHPKEWIDKKHKVVIKTREEKLKINPKKKHRAKDRKTNGRTRNFAMQSK
jgi:uncharacterized protein YutD